MIFYHLLFLLCRITLRMLMYFQTEDLSDIVFFCFLFIFCKLYVCLKFHLNYFYYVTFFVKNIIKIHSHCAIMILFFIYFHCKCNIHIYFKFFNTMIRFMLLFKNEYQNINHDNTLLEIQNSQFP